MENLVFHEIFRQIRSFSRCWIQAKKSIAEKIQAGISVPGGGYYTLLYFPLQHLDAGWIQKIGIGAPKKTTSTHLPKETHPGPCVNGAHIASFPTSSGWSCRYITRPSTTACVGFFLAEYGVEERRGWIISNKQKRLALLENFVIFIVDLSQSHE